MSRTPERVAFLLASVNEEGLEHGMSKVGAVMTARACWRASNMLIGEYNDEYIKDLLQQINNVVRQCPSPHIQELLGNAYSMLELRIKSRQ